MVILRILFCLQDLSENLFFVRIELEVWRLMDQFSFRLVLGWYQ